MKSKGFSLIELLIVVMILGIISAIAYPSYTQYVTRTNRADAMGALMTAASAMERRRASSFVYGEAGDEPPVQTVPVDATNDSDVKYRITFSDGPSRDAYELTATPDNSMIGRDGTGTLTINQRGEKTWNGINGQRDCWPESGGDDC